ncbi:hypothetical protein ACJJVE_21495 [Klebsiella quasipneumoniae]
MTKIRRKAYRVIDWKKSDLRHIKLTIPRLELGNDGVLCDFIALISLTKKGRINKSNAKKEVKLEYFK